MLTLASILSLGFVLGMRHATDADHVIAVSTMVTRERSIRQAAMRGILWGIGHSMTLLIVGGAIILFGLVVPDRLGLGLEFSVGLMLILLGILNIATFKQWIDSGETPPESLTTHARAHRHLRPVAVGVVHGLAGSAAVALLVLPLIQKPIWGVLYLAIFGAGTVGGMMIITAAMAVPFKWTSGRFAHFNQGLALASGFISLSFGILLVYQIGFVKGLFT